MFEDEEICITLITSKYHMYSGLMQVCGEKIQEVLFVVLVEQKSSLV
jgi:hypothetical protein